MKRKMVSLLAMLVAMTVMLGMCMAPASAEEFDPSKYTMAVYLWPTSNPTVAVMAAGFMQTAVELGYNAMVIGGDISDPALGFQMVDSALAQHDLAGMTYNATEETAWKKLKEITDAGVPVVCIWNRVTQENLDLYGVDPNMVLGWYAPDAADYGYECGLVMGEACDGKGTLAVTQSMFNETEDAAAAGFRKAIAEKYPDMVVLDTQLEGLETVAGISVITAIIQGNQDLVGAFGTTGTSAQTWAAAKKNTGWDGKMIGMDFTAQNLDLLENGDIFGIVAQPIYSAFGECAKQIDRYLRGQEMIFDNPYPSPIIYKDDVPQYRELISNIPVYQGNAVVSK